ncbi:MAG: hypothetical protein ACOCTR_02665 [Candidatus Natronoplasma sp.]
MEEPDQGSDIEQKEKKPEDSPSNICPHCGHYVGPVETCPYCKKEIPKRQELKLLKTASVVFAVIGVLLLWQYSVSVGYPTPKIGEIEETMNYSNVELEGKVVKGATYYSSEATGDGTIYFTIDDGTGQMRVVAYSSQAEKLIEEEKIPSFGDHVSFVGTINYRGTDVKVILSSAHSLTIEREEGREYTISELNEKGRDEIEEGMRATVSGRIRGGVEDLDFGYKFDIESENGTMPVFIYKDTVRLTGGEMADGRSLGELEAGDNITITGGLSWYHGWELIPAEVSDIQVEGEVESGG